MLKRIARKIRDILDPLDVQKELYSTELRTRFASYGIDVGLYSYGCFDLSRISAGVTIGRYCSFAPSCHIYRRNHGLEFIGLTPFFYQPILGVTQTDSNFFSSLSIEDDVWIGHAAIIVPGVTQIGRGAAIGAGAVVTKNVAPYTIVAGNPAKAIRRRFDDQTIAWIEATQWWTYSPQDLRKIMEKSPELLLNPSEIVDKARALQTFKAVIGSHNEKS